MSTKLFDDVVIVKGKAYADYGKTYHMSSTRVLKEVQFENSPLRDLLLKISANFRCLYIEPLTSEPSSKSAGKLAKQAEELNQQIYKQDLNFLNSDAKSDWMELKFEEALRHSADEWGPTGYILNEQSSPTANKTKRRYSDMTSSSQGGIFLPSEQIVEEDEDENAGEDGDEGTEENVQPPRTRRRLR